jgi:hypothetical protein
MIRKIANLVITIILLTTVLVSSITVIADSGPKLKYTSAEVIFPHQLIFNLKAESNTKITDIRLHYQVDRDHFALVTNEILIEFTPSKKVIANWTWDMIMSGGLPTGTNVTYWWTLTDTNNVKIETERYITQFNDERYQWQTLTEDDITIYWYKGDYNFAEKLMEVAHESLINLEKDTGAYLLRPVKLYVYANTQDLQGAMIFPQEWTGGVAYTKYGIVAIGINESNLEWGKRTIIHELTHLVIQQMTFNPYNSIPVWLNEGLSMYAEGEMEPVFNNYLKRAVVDNELISVRSLASPFSTNTELSYLSYAQSMSIVEYLIERFGQEKMLELLNTFRQGSNYVNALMKVYNIDIDDLNNQWQDYIKAQY